MSLRQPWADLIAYRYKVIETRTWDTKFRGPCLIHASKQVDKEAMAHFKRLYNLPYNTGGIVGWMNISGTKYYATEREYFVDCTLHRVSEVHSPKKEIYGFIIDQCAPHKLIPCNGRLNFFNIPLEITSKFSQVMGYH